MDTIFATVACCLLAVSFAEAHTEKMNLTIMPTTTTPGLNLNHTSTLVTSSNTTVHATVISNISEDTTSFTSTTWDNGTFNETTSHPQTSQSTTVLNPLTRSSLLTTTTPGTHTSSFTAVTMPVIQSTAGYISTPDTSVITTANSSNTVNTTSDSVDRITQGFGLDISEKNMTIVFSVALGVFGVALVIFMFHRCKQKIQYLHQPLNNTNDTDAFVADDDTLIISGGLYDGHPIYDNVPTAPEDQSQFRLEFLH
ncbi:flocculation protein FLO9-like [Seriola dumerili]|uniref:flocculation protein FLO9-like n=1 Tax=Seriola dumerili TaxID=41447 RepID=UPI000BBF0385|nr:flocculation protein FLO9-like [Seriola dumerili]XP_022597887.1 flocculation protein FLO9-like [Seriola dumerili]XP_022597888.1 flocculation protein FLO9-like [Seriola dumerili]XP_022597889.1 flocculation protein FLO9-like [Seriola dumerili]